MPKWNRDKIPEDVDGYVNKYWRTVLRDRKITKMVFVPKFELDKPLVARELLRYRERHGEFPKHQSDVSAFFGGRFKKASALSAQMRKEWDMSLGAFLAEMMK